MTPWPPGGNSLRRLRAPAWHESVQAESSMGSTSERTLSEVVKTIIRRVEELADKGSQDRTDQGGQKVVSLIVGVNSSERVKESIVSDITLTPEEVNYLEEPYASESVCCPDCAAP